MNFNKYNYIIILYILLIIYIYINKIRSLKLALLIILIVIISIIIGWIIEYYKLYNRNTNKECLFLLNDNKQKESGLIFGSCIDYWHILHLLLYIIIGLLIPYNYYIIISISILWEIFEHYVFKYITKKCNDILCGRIEDILLNITGYIIGNILCII